MKNWTEEFSYEKPEELQLIAPSLYMQRRNIQQYIYKEDPTDSQSEIRTGWRCESREITISEYNLIKSIEEIKTNEAIDDYTMQLIEEGILG